MPQLALDSNFPPRPHQLFDLVYREETLLNVIKSVTRNGRSIVLTAVLALILVYLFSIVGYIFFKDDFILAVDRIPNKTLGRLGHSHYLLCGVWMQEVSVIHDSCGVIKQSLFYPCS